jgi:formylglycine-generating enzyme required for sulfatase activity
MNKNRLPYIFLLSVLILLLPTGWAQGMSSRTTLKRAADTGESPVYLPLILSAPATNPGTPPPAGMVQVQAGSFTRGCVEGHNGGHECILTPWATTSDDLPAASIYLNAFNIDVTEVTNAQYAACVAQGGCTNPADQSSTSHSAYFDNPVYANYPVINVTWGQANAYCAWAGKRLPSEAEWEKAARGSLDSRAFPWGDAAPTCALASFGGCEQDTSAVGSTPAGASLYGAMDMAGNVSEWVNDWYGEDYYKSAPSVNPLGPGAGDKRVMRGGSWSAMPCRGWPRG